MTSSSVDLRHPIDSTTAGLLCRLAGTARAQTVDVLLVGAFAREVLFYHVHGIETGIGTLDKDISVRVPDWDAFNRLRHALVGAGLKTVQDDVPEKMREDANGIEVDLIPFGPIAGTDFRLHWPNNGPVWNVMGFREAFDSEPTAKYLVDRLQQETTSASECPLAKALAHRICKGSFARARKLLSAVLEGFGA